MTRRLSDTTTRRTVQAEIVARAPLERVWRAWTEPELLQGWWADPPGAGPALQTIEATRPGHLVLAARTPESEVDIQLSSVGWGTRIQLAQSGLPVEPQRQDEVEGVRSGWVLALAALRVYLEGHFGKVPRHFSCFRTARFTFERLDPFFREAPELARWLVQQGSIGVPGGYSDLVLWDGRRVSGEVLADTGREISTTWDEVSGILELRAFGRGGGVRMLGVQGLGWGLDLATGQAMDHLLPAALERLIEAVAEVA